MIHGPLDIIGYMSEKKIVKIGETDFFFSNYPFDSFDFVRVCGYMWEVLKDVCIETIYRLTRHDMSKERMYFVCDTSDKVCIERIIINKECCYSLHVNGLFPDYDNVVNVSSDFFRYTYAVFLRCNGLEQEANYSR